MLPVSNTGNCRNCTEPAQRIDPAAYSETRTRLSLERDAGGKVLPEGVHREPPDERFRHRRRHPRGAGRRKRNGSSRLGSFAANLLSPFPKGLLQAHRLLQRQTVGRAANHKAVLTRKQLPAILLNIED